MDKLIKKYDRKPIKCDLTSLTPIKLTLDDVLGEYLRVEMKYKQSHLFTDLRIFVGLVSTIMSVYLTYLSMNKEFKEYKYICFVIVGVFAVLNGLLELILRVFARGTIFSGKKEDERICVYSNISRADTNYIVMVYKDGKLIPDKYNKDVRDLFDEDGMLLHKLFIEELNYFLKEGKKDK
ncbi:hypothetical protein EDEG_00168 [Edhazardia aedis USNM 41457]|uniref:Signal peptidase complex subunit 2 n=1 Tax=Edhazardia aedis (strain USNM 41457) TaxID=1003232 RepID=J9DM58_EDHAE|nr:hypothetical protein EDEG_00168 [Edhazardia aedis USNM 41457]|eukprot:EJW03680.1 hypothetical protein EDEG_00168 [Edhazardia aedis USNM 41457]